jgi:hypothetical protein
MSKQVEPEGAVKALMLGRIAEQHGSRYSGLGGWDEFHKDRPADAERLRELATGDVRAVAAHFYKHFSDQLLTEASLQRIFGELAPFDENAPEVSAERRKRLRGALEALGVTTMPEVDRG